MVVGSRSPSHFVGRTGIGYQSTVCAGEKIKALAHMLEEDEETQAFARYLRGEEA